MRESLHPFAAFLPTGSGRAQMRSRPISVQPSGPTKIGAVGADAKASTTATPRSSASCSCFRSSATKTPRPRATGSVVACTENEQAVDAPITMR